MPKISAKFRKRFGVPYAIEIISGIQFRCRHCNAVFQSDRELNIHIKNLLKYNNKKRFTVSKSCPKLSFNTDISVLYTYDISDRLKREWLKLKKGDEYDEIQS